MGDLNIDQLQNNKPAQTVRYICDNMGLSQLIKDPTRTTGSTSTCIDLIITDIKWVKLAGVVECNMSDHSPIFLARKKNDWPMSVKKLNVAVSKILI